MHADQLRMAVTKIIDTLIRSDVRSLVDQFRVAKDDQRTAAAARLGNAGATIVGRFDTLSDDERRVVEVLHLDKLSTTEYWQALISPETDPKVARAESVKLQSRIVFAISHLPGMISLLEGSSTPSNPAPYERHAVASGQSRLIVRLTDASVASADPDRIARAIDGIDMLYSACASIVQKQSVDLRLDGMDGVSPLRDLHFTGDQDCVASVITILESIPEALARIEPDQDIDVESVVQSLPVFAELDAIVNQGSFSATDMKDIRDSVFQGAVLSLESGAILLDPTGSASAPAGVDDEHYERYLREREAMQHGKSEASTDSQMPDVTENPVENTVVESATNADNATAERPQAKDLLSSLIKERNQ